MSFHKPLVVLCGTDCHDELPVGDTIYPKDVPLSLLTDNIIRYEPDGLYVKRPDYSSIPEWDAGIQYEAGWLVRAGNDTYIARVINTGFHPATNPAEWRLLIRPEVSDISATGYTSDERKALRANGSWDVTPLVIHEHSDSLSVNTFFSHNFDVFSVTLIRNINNTFTVTCSCPNDYLISGEMRWNNANMKTYNWYGSGSHVITNEAFTGNHAGGLIEFTLWDSNETECHVKIFCVKATGFFYIKVTS